MTQSITWILILLGIIAVLAARLLSGVETHPPLFAVVLETLGVTTATVMSVKLIYEKFVAKEHFHQFLGLLRTELADFQAQAAMAPRLGVRQTFLTRSTYLEQYSLEQIVSRAPVGSRLRIVGLSLFYVTNRVDILRDALRKDLVLELCMLDPSRITDDIRALMKLYPEDITASIRSLTRLLAENPPTTGVLEVRTCPFLIMDSIAAFIDSDRSLTIAWDLNFGRDVGDKRVFLLDATKQLGIDLSARYEAVWNLSEVQIRFRKGNVEVNNWTNA